jgi:UDP-2-acetamido-2,6-beta-L-arabino-hexul-4-ose reductase
MKVVVTGGNGFIGLNLRVRLQELGRYEVISVTRDTTESDLRSALADASFVFHLAGVNRPKDVREFHEGNTVTTARLCGYLRDTRRPPPVLYASSSQATRENEYGRSKRAAEMEIERYAADTGAAATILRLWNVFGKWARPNYNSAVATFCHNLARGLPIVISDAAAPLKLIHVEDVVNAMVDIMESGTPRAGLIEVGPVHETTVGALAETLRAFAASRDTSTLGGVGRGFLRALYSTYVSYLPPDGFSYRLTTHADPRGLFAEVLRTHDSGQFSFFVARPGVTRGGHYHHVKTEKFLVLTGQARFRFRNIVTGERHELFVEGSESRVVETVPGWAHDITNMGTDDLVVMLWANEVFDPSAPDTTASEVWS